MIAPAFRVIGSGDKFVVTLGRVHLKSYDTKCSARSVASALKNNVTDGWHGAEAEAIRKSLNTASGVS